MTLGSFHMGSTVVLLRNFDPVQVLADIERYRVTHMFGAPAMFLFMSQQPQFADTDLGSVKNFICGAAPVPESLIELYAERGVDFCQGYGLTETAPFSVLPDPGVGDQQTGLGRASRRCTAIPASSITTTNRWRRESAAKSACAAPIS